MRGRRERRARGGARNRAEGNARRVEGSALVNHCTAAALALQSDLAHVDGVSEAVWHYLSDADLRVKDPEYAAQQLSQLLKVVGLVSAE